MQIVDDLILERLYREVGSPYDQIVSQSDCHW